MKEQEPDREQDFATTLSAALDRRGWTLTMLQRRLMDRGHQVSLESLSYWRTGRRVPSTASSLTIVDDIEQLLDLPPRTLVKLARPRRRGRPPTRSTYNAIPGPPPGTDAALTELGLLGDSGLDEISAHISVHVDAQFRVRWATNRQVLQANRDFPDRLPAVLVDEVPFEEPPVIEGVSGCRLGRRIDHPQDGVSVVEVLLATPPGIRSATMIETRLHFTPVDPPPWGEFGYHLTTQLRECAMRVQFTSQRPTDDAYAFVISADGEREPVPCLVSDREIQAIVFDFGPGRLYVRWASS